MVCEMTSNETVKKLVEDVIFLTYDMLNLGWAYQDRTSSTAEENLYIKQIQEDSERQREG